jgi:hypothetical protein
MKKHRALKVIGVILLVTAIFFLLGFVVMALWNWLMPTIFGMHTITYWQAFGLLILSKIIFGGFRGGRGRGHGRGCGSRPEWRERMAERWDTMSPETREKAREAMRGYWCGEPPIDKQPIEPKSDSAD